MINFDVIHRHTGDVLFAAEIDCGEDAPRAQKLRLAVLRAIKTGPDMRYADLRDADLRNADLRDADMRNAYMRYADLRDADMRGACMCGADMRGAYMCGADLREADLRGADLRGADLREADLRGADLRGAKGYIVGPQRSDGWRFDLRYLEGKWRVVAGCRTERNWTTAQFREHAAAYDDPQKQAETLAILDYLDALAAVIGGEG